MLQEAHALLVHVGIQQPNCHTFISEQKSAEILWTSVDFHVEGEVQKWLYLVHLGKERYYS